MSDFTFFSEAFWVGLTAGGFAFLGLIVRYAYKSKCKEFEVCCIKIKRDIESERQEDIVAMEHGIAEPSTPTLAPVTAPTPLSRPGQLTSLKR
jgi:hypothetical protein